MVLESIQRFIVILVTSAYLWTESGGWHFVTPGGRGNVMAKIQNARHHDTNFPTTSLLDHILVYITVTP